MFGHDPAFWLSVAGATLVRIVTSQKRSLVRSAFTVFAAIFAAYVFTDPSLDYLRLSPDTYKAPVAALWALTGEGVMRWVINASQDPLSAVRAVLAAWRGK